MGTRQFVVDGSWQRYARVVVAGSPLRIYRLTAAGETVVRVIEDGGGVAMSRLVERLLDGGAIHPRVVTAGSPPAAACRFGRGDVTVVTPQLGGTIRRGAPGRVVVDDGSRPALDGATLRLPVNRGPAAARNAGRTLVDTPLIAFVDADVDVDPGAGSGVHWLDALLPHFDDDRVGLVAPRVLGERGSPLDLGDRPARIRAGTRVSYVPGAAMVMRTAAFDAVGGFDERLRFGEDVDLVWRLDERGWGCRYEPGSTVFHQPRPNLMARMRQHEGYGTSAAPLVLRHPRALAPFVANRWTAGVWSLAALGHPIVAGAAAVGSACALPRTLSFIPRPAAFGLAMRGHAGAGGQVARAVRREWWPLVAVGALVSRRLRWVAVGAALAGGTSLPTDLAYGWGVWRGMIRHRSSTAIKPRLITWPPRAAGHTTRARG